MSRILDLRDAARRHQPRLPAMDGTPHDLADALRQSAVGTWRGRMINEHESGVVFDVLAEQLQAADADPQAVERCRKFAEEERHHGVLCGAVVQALGGQARAELPAEEPVPRHAEVDPLEAALRNLISISCLSETVAVALIGAEREEMPEGELRTLLSRIWTDERGHANFGWLLLGQLLDRPDARRDPQLAQRLGDWLRLAFAHLEEHELAHLPTVAFPEEGAALGLCGGPGPRRLFLATVQRIILPGLTAHGIPARQAWEQRHAA